jgi:hypothetical protein
MLSEDEIAAPGLRTFSTDHRRDSGCIGLHAAVSAAPVRKGIRGQLIRMVGSKRGFFLKFSDIEK